MIGIQNMSKFVTLLKAIMYIFFGILDAILLHYGIILPEEKYLEKEFDKVYLDYKNSVRRWI